MRKNQLLSAMFVMAAAAVTAQTLPEGMVALIPEGVSYNIATTVQPQKEKGLVVAGSPEKGYKAFFAASDATHGEELWMTDGTPEGTKLVKDICPGATSSSIAYLTRFNDKVVFAATDGENGVEPWISDGTEEGTFMIKDIHELESSYPMAFTQVNENQLVFMAMDLDSETYFTDGTLKYLYVTDGTEEGTQMIFEADCKWPGRFNDVNGQFNPWTRVGRKVFFKAEDLDAAYGDEMYVTDGTPEGTHIVYDVNDEVNATGTAGAANSNFVNYYNEGLIFSAWTFPSGHEYWYAPVEGNTAHKLCELNPLKNESGSGKDGGCNLPCNVPFGSKIFSRGTSPVYGNELAIIDVDKCLLNPGGDNEDCFEIVDINLVDPTVSNNSYPTYFVNFKGYVWTQATNGSDANIPECVGGEVFVINPETNEVRCFVDLNPGTGSLWPKGYIVVGGSMYFFAGGGLAGGQSSLFRIDDPTENKIHQVTHFNETGDKINSLTNLNGTLLFCSDTNKQMYAYTYRSEYYNAEEDADVMEPEYRTRAEMEDAVEVIKGEKELNVKVVMNADGTIAKVVTSNEIVDVKVYNVQGMQVAASANEEIKVADLAAGVYMVNVKTVNGTATVKLLKK